MTSHITKLFLTLLWSNISGGKGGYCRKHETRCQGNGKIEKAAETRVECYVSLIIYLQIAFY